MHERQDMVLLTTFRLLLLLFLTKQTTTNMLPMVCNCKKGLLTVCNYPSSLPLFDILVLSDSLPLFDILVLSDSLQLFDILVLSDSLQQSGPFV